MNTRPNTRPNRRPNMKSNEENFVGYKGTLYFCYNAQYYEVLFVLHSSVKKIKLNRPKFSSFPFVFGLVFVFV